MSGTYVVAHAFTSAAIPGAIAAGVKCIEHGVLMDEATAKLIAERGIRLSLQPLPEALKLGFPVGSVQRAKAEEVWPGIARSYELAKKYKIKTAWGTDVLFSRALAQQQGAILASLTRWYTPAEALAMATGTNAELLALSGKRNPYPGKLGVVEQGALADLILVDGNPLENINLVADPDQSFLVIMKDGRAYKNTVPKSSPVSEARSAGRCRYKSRLSHRWVTDRGGWNAAPRGAGQWNEAPFIPPATFRARESVPMTEISTVKYVLCTSFAMQCRDWCSCWCWQ